jgi:hypothetical protein
MKGQIMVDLSKEYVIQQVEAHKDRIRDASDRLSDILYEGRKHMGNNLRLGEERSLAIRKIIHEIFSELSIIGGFCDSWTQRYIQQTAHGVGTIIAKQLNYADALMLEYWAVNINSLIIDYNKTPFRLSDLKPLLSVLQKAFGWKPS